MSFQSIRRTKREMVSSLDGDHSKAKMIGHSTLEYFRPDGSKVIRFHLTDVVTIAPDGSVTLDSGGFKTPTTKKRMNDYLPGGFGIFADRGVWYVSTNYDAPRYVFCDGMTIAPDGTVTGSSPDEEQRVKKIRKQIKGYCDAMKALDELPKPGAGDCWVCQFPNPTCTQSHLDEIYIHGTLILNAMREARDTDYVISLAFNTKKAGSMADLGRERAVRAVRRYLAGKMGLSR